MAYSLGVDLGTTFLAAAVARPTGVRMVTLGDRTVVAPAVVDIGDDGILTGSAAERRAAGHPDRLGRELKRRLGDPSPIRLGGLTHPVAALLGAQLRDVVARVADIEGGRPERIVLTHPASWSSYRREQFGEVARAAGIETPQMVTEAEAVVSSALADRLHDGQIVAIYDLGGGTLEATVVRKQADGIEILGAAGMDEFGGVDFDEAILSHIDHATGGALSGTDGDDPQAAVALARLRQECVLAKEALSRDTETVIPVFLPGWHVEVRLTRWAFEEMVRPAVVTTMGVLSRAVQSAGLISSDLSAVLLMGGSSRIPLVTEMLSQEFGRPTVDGVHPKYPVALGAASTATASVVTAGSLPARSVAPGSRGGYADVGPAQRGDEVRATDPADVAADSAGPATGNDVRAYAGPNRFDQPTQMLVVPRHEPDLLPLVPAVDPHPRRSRRRVPLAAAAAAAAVLVLALVYFLAPGPPAAPPVAPAAPAAPSTSAPVTSATGPTVTPTTASPTTASPTTASPTTSSTARRGGAAPRTRGATTSSRPRRPGA
jgi:actin-like ATPase involved in cell morphogenesis